MSDSEENVDIYEEVIKKNGYMDIVKRGEGMFGVVFEVKKGEKSYAIKCEKPVLEFDKEKIKVIKERKRNEKKNFDEIVNGKLKHPNIVCHFSYFFGLLPKFNNQEVSFIVMELCKCSLEKWFIDNPQNREYQICFKMFEGIAKGLQHIHDYGIIHRDLKPGNILISIDGMICKIADFGFSKNVFDDLKFTRRHGTPLYTAPELTNENRYDYKVDIYSLGCIFMEFFSEFNDDKELEKALKNLRKQILPKNFFNAVPDKIETAKALAISMTGKKPIDRAPIKRILFECKQLCNDLFKTESEGKREIT
jgi:serine/threonine protein kinase